MYREFPKSYSSQFSTSHPSAHEVLPCPVSKRRQCSPVTGLPRKLGEYSINQALARLLPLSSLEGFTLKSMASTHCVASRLQQAGVYRAVHNNQTATHSAKHNLLPTSCHKPALSSGRAISQNIALLARTQGGRRREWACKGVTRAEGLLLDMPSDETSLM